MNNFSRTIRALTLASIAIVPLAATANALSFVASQAPGEQSTSGLIGMKVENAAGDKLGDINYLVLDGAGKISTVVIGVGGFLGVGEKNIGVAYGDVKISDKDGRKIALVDATKDSLNSAPSYVWKEKSTMDTVKEDASDLAKKAKDAAGMNKDPSPSTTPAPSTNP